MNEEWVRLAARYCAGRERSPREVANKLRLWGAEKAEQQAIMERLRKEQLLDESRFAEHYTSGHFRMKGWGKAKIEAALRAEGIPPAVIQKALRTISETDYRLTIEKLARAKWRTVADQHEQRTLKYLLQKGFAFADTAPVVKKLSAAHRSAKSR